MSKQFQGKPKAGDKGRGRRAGHKGRGKLALPMGTPLGYFMSVLSRQPARFDPFKGRVLEIPLLAVENRIQHLSRKLQSINPLNCHCTKRR